jgi:ATP-dependent protease ClpP protease subunit
VNPLKQMRAARIKALADGTAAPAAFFWEDPELLTTDNGGVFQIYFTDMIDDWFGISAGMIVEALLAADGRDVLVHLNSPGGMVTEGLAIHSAFKQYSGKVTFRVEGMAASAASFVMLAGDEVVIEPAALVMIHDAWDVTVGPASEHRKTADLLDKVSDSIAGMYAGKAGGDAADWRALMIEETWYAGQEAVDAGLADSVVEPRAADTANATSRGPAARWSGIFAKAPKTATEWGGEKPADDPEPDPVEPATEPETEPRPEGKITPDAVEKMADQDTEDLAKLLAGIDLSAALRNAFPTRGVPA